MTRLSQPKVTPLSPPLQRRFDIPSAVSDENAILTRVRSLAFLLDAAFTIPGTRVRIGLDALMGVVPIIGDVIGAVLSLYIVKAASQLGVPRPVRARMYLNIAIDAALGAIPILGDVFDVVWRANLRNVTLLERSLVAPRAVARESVFVLLAAVVTVVLLLCGVAFIIHRVLAAI